MAFLPHFKFHRYHRLIGDTAMCEAKTIYHHLRTNLLIQWTWGFHTPKSLHNGLQFSVRGLAFQGTVRIRLGEQVRKMWDIALDSLISVLDRNIDGVDGDFWSEFKKRYVLNQVKR